MASKRQGMGSSAVEPLLRAPRATAKPSAGSAAVQKARAAKLFPRVASLHAVSTDALSLWLPFGRRLQHPIYRQLAVGLITIATIAWPVFPQLSTAPFARHVYIDRCEDSNRTVVPLQRCIECNYDRNYVSVYPSAVFGMPVDPLWYGEALAMAFALVASGAEVFAIQIGRLHVASMRVLSHGVYLGRTARGCMLIYAMVLVIVGQLVTSLMVTGLAASVTREREQLSCYLSYGKYYAAFSPDNPAFTTGACLAACSACFASRGSSQRAVLCFVRCTLHVAGRTLPEIVWKLATNVGPFLFVVYRLWQQARQPYASLAMGNVLKDETLAASVHEKVKYKLYWNSWASTEGRKKSSLWALMTMDESALQQTLLRLAKHLHPIRPALKAKAAAERAALQGGQSATAAGDSDAADAMDAMDAMDAWVATDSVNAADATSSLAEADGVADSLVELTEPEGKAAAPGEGQ